MKKFLTLFLGIALVYSCSTNSDGNGNSTTTVVPVAPSNLTGIVFSPNQINLTWTDNSTNETGFKIERKTGNGTYALVGTTANDVTTFNDIGLTSGTVYTYRLYSFNLGGSSISYSNEFSSTTGAIDVDGNLYELVTICNQTWTKSNLNVSHYRNGDVIPQVTTVSQLANSTSGAWCYYNNDPSNGAIYGKLYNWYAIIDQRGLAPAGYHIPTDLEWTDLSTCLGGESIAGGKMKSLDSWNSPNIGATNISGFSGMAGGDFDISYNQTLGLGSRGYWWSTTQSNTDGAWVRRLNSSTITIDRVAPWKKNCLSVRCIKD